MEHTETHEGLDKTKNTVPPPHICKKTFRKLHHLSEHKEVHLESNKSENKKSTLVAKDIIHGCPLCFMVFPNEHSLEKHTIICQRKK